MVDKKLVAMGNRAAKVSEDSKWNNDKDDISSTKEEKQIVIADSREDQEVRAGCVYVTAFRTMFRHFSDIFLRTGTVWEILQKAN